MTTLYYLCVLGTLIEMIARTCRIIRDIRKHLMINQIQTFKSVQWYDKRLGTEGRRMVI